MTRVTAYYWLVDWQTHRHTMQHSDGGPYRTRDQACDTIQRVIAQIRETGGWWTASHVMPGTATEEELAQAEAYRSQATPTPPCQK